MTGYSSESTLEPDRTTLGQTFIASTAPNAVARAELEQAKARLVVPPPVLFQSQHVVTAGTRHAAVVSATSLIAASECVPAAGAHGTTTAVWSVEGGACD